MRTMARQHGIGPVFRARPRRGPRGGRGLSLKPPAGGIDGIGGRAGDGLPAVQDFPRLSVRPLPVAFTPAAACRDIPAVGETGLIVDQPTAAGVSPAPAPPAASGGSCGQPRSMEKVTSGAFLGGLSMDSYFPDLVGRGFYDHPGTGGAFDTGSRAGANIQLLGVIHSPCRPGQYRLAQTITRTRFRINGVRHAEEGMTFDDVAKSGRDATTAPFRQEFLGGGDAPFGYLISMADPPSTGYGARDTIEHDRDFVTSLIGPAGTVSVRWSLTTRIANGRVTRNTLS